MGVTTTSAGTSEIVDNAGVKVGSGDEVSIDVESGDGEWMTMGGEIIS